MNFIFQIISSGFTLCTLCLFVRAVLKGANYVGASDFGWSERAQLNYWGQRKFSRLLFKLTPASVLLTAAITGYLMFQLAFSPLNYFRIWSESAGGDVELGQILATSLGPLLGIGFGSHYLRICSRIACEIIAEIGDPAEQLKRLLG